MATKVTLKNIITSGVNTESTKETNSSTSHIRATIATTDNKRKTSKYLSAFSSGFTTRASTSTILTSNSVKTRSLSVKTTAIANTSLTPALDQSAISLTTLIPIVVIVAVLIVLTLVIILWCCRRKDTTKYPNVVTTTESQNKNRQELYESTESKKLTNIVDNVLYVSGRYSKADDAETYNKLYIDPQNKARKQSGQQDDYCHITISNNTSVLLNERKEIYNELYLSKELADNKNKINNSQCYMKIEERVEKTRNQNSFSNGARPIS